MLVHYRHNRTRSRLVYSNYVVLNYMDIVDRYSDESARTTLVIQNKRDQNGTEGSPAL